MRFDCYLTLDLRGKKSAGELPALFLNPGLELEADSESHWDKLSRRSFRKDVVETRFDEGIEATETKRGSDSAIDSKVALGVRVEIVTIQLCGIDSTATDQVWADSGAWQ